MAQTRISHERKIKSTEPAGQNWAAIFPGTTIQFKYNKLGTSDPKPLVLFLWRDMQKKLVHGVNLNYLNEYLVQKMYNMLNEFTTVDTRATEVLEEGYTRAFLPRHGRGRYSAKSLYDNVLKPKVLANQHCYRTWSMSKVSNIKVVEYDWKPTKNESMTTKLERIHKQDIESGENENTPQR
jgi:hypothetical protein